MNSTLFDPRLLKSNRSVVLATYLIILVLSSVLGGLSLMCTWYSWPVDAIYPPAIAGFVTGLFYWWFSRFIVGISSDSAELVGVFVCIMGLAVWDVVFRGLMLRSGVSEISLLSAIVWVSFCIPVSLRIFSAGPGHFGYKKRKRS